MEAKSKNYLFSTVNLSMGVETGLSNSLSLLIAPYVKVPTRGMGFGQVQITSVGLQFCLKIRARAQQEKEINSFDQAVRPLLPFRFGIKPHQGSHYSSPRCN